ncbi:acyl-coenzyme A thioesterase 9, mitochondrial [Acrasis kona]|uniref:Acyl-coenzyme A thioesterase 9, mitochondrial n=1 Tax=Acrasis kona TaxID=1008807 RepID=A0AAW2YR98_9EUKA
MQLDDDFSNPYHRRSMMQQKYKELVQKTREAEQHLSEFALRKKAPKESFSTMSLPFSTQPNLRNNYSSMDKYVRIGRILEDFDWFAALIAYKHADGFSQHRPVYIVTACVDRIDLKHPPTIEDDLFFEGWVTWVGNSSMEVRIEAKAKDIQVMEAYFVMVARTKDHKSAPVHQLLINNTEDEIHYQAGERNQERRKRASVNSLSLKPPNERETSLIHEFFKEEEKRRRGFEIQDISTATMNSTLLTNSRLLHPQNKNTHGKIFGGYIMREGIELAYCAAAWHSKSRPMFMSLDDNYFMKAVEINSFMTVTARVAYTVGEFCVVRVEAMYIKPPRGDKEFTNLFHFTFRVSDEQPKVVPESYVDAMYYLSAKRVFEKGSSAV